MKYFKNDTTGEVFAYEEDGSQDRLISDELRAMSDAEIAEHIKPVDPPSLPEPTKAELMQKVTALMLQIEALE